ncbi:DUF3927 family protein [Franconibacter helveticus]|uniref:DUF3927 family protein n=1 Tax=Franconibacter helveticus TaxID=357240 RepID=UPI002909B3D6|nr:DUF3927 family protein [Franconibacter helveticus]MDU6923637.1 DUF3927 family protein [Franconibacter helveticus]
MMNKLRFVAAGVLLFLVIAIDFTSKVMSVLADGVLVAGAVLLLLPLLKTTE